jgi:GDP-L-fucose synthase
MPKSRVNLTDQKAVHGLLEELRPDWVFLAAARVGGIYANSTYPAEFIYTNLMIEANVIHASYMAGVKKLLFLGSSCIYPRDAPQPMKEEYLLSGYLEKTNTPYAVAKIAGIVMVQSYNRQYGTSFIPVMPSNLFGPNDNYNLKDSHVVPAMLRKTHEAKCSGADFVEIWGSGNPLREFLYVDDLADACLFIMENCDSAELLNIGTGSDLSIRELALMIKDIVGFTGEIRFNPEMPDGTPRKLLDVSRLNALGWKPSKSLREGLTEAYRWYVQNESIARR